MELAGDGGSVLLSSPLSSTQSSDSSLAGPPPRSPWRPAGTCSSRYSQEVATLHRSDPREIGARIARARRELGVTQHEFAQRFGVTTRMLQYYEAGRFVPYRYLDRLSHVTGRSPRWFLEGEQANSVSDTVESALRESLVALDRQLSRLDEEVGQLRALREANRRLLVTTRSLVRDARAPGA
jgi:transcriptional regulator with XRE-family HTH domain